MTIITVIDTETTGLVDPDVVQFGYCTLDLDNYQIVLSGGNVKIVDTLALAKKLIPKEESGDHKLGTLYYYLGCNNYHKLNGNLHGAGVDSEVCAVVLYFMLKKYNLTIDQVYELLTTPEPKEDVSLCPFNKHKGKLWKDVANEDKDYLIWLLNSDKIKSTEMKELVKSLIK